jgi:hypothetical protein
MVDSGETGSSLSSQQVIHNLSTTYQTVRRRVIEGKPRCSALLQNSWSDGGRTFSMQTGQTLSSRLFVETRDCL